MSALFILFNFIAKFQSTVIMFFFSLEYTHRIGTFGFMCEYGAEKKVSKYSSVVASVSIGQPTGVIMKVKYVLYMKMKIH